MTRYRHKKRGSTYVTIGTAQVQASEPIREDDTVMVYRGETDGTVWARPLHEFQDGRFEELPETDDEIGELVKQLRAWVAPIESGYEVPAAGAVIERAASALETLSAERKLREALEAAIRGHLDGPTQMHVFAVTRTTLQEKNTRKGDLYMYHWRDGLFFMRHEDGNVEIFKCEGDPLKSTHKTLTIAVIPESEWASIICSVSKDGETSERYAQAVRFHTGDSRP